jgi:transposase
MSKTRPPYPAAFRQQIIELVCVGRTPAQLSREFNVRPGRSRTGCRKPMPTQASLTA